MVGKLKMLASHVQFGHTDFILAHDTRRNTFVAIFAMYSYDVLQ